MFMAPELFNTSEKKALIDGHATDMWACGVVFYALIMNGKMPFTSRTEREMITRIQRGIYHTGEISSLSQQLLQRMLNVNAMKRAKPEDILAMLKANGVNYDNVDGKPTPDDLEK